MCIRDSKSPAAPARLSAMLGAHGRQDDQPTPLFSCEIFGDLDKRLSKRIHVHCWALPDTGATSTAISIAFAAKHGFSFRPTATTLRSADSGDMEVVGEVDLQLLYRGRTVALTALVVQGLAHDIFVAWHHCTALRVVDLFPDVPHGEAALLSATAAPAATAAPPSLSEAELLRERLMLDFSDVFSDKLEGRSLNGTPMHIDLRDDVPLVPKRVYTARQVPLHYQADAQQLVDQLLEGGIIEPVSTPTDWISPAHFVEKPGGAGVRLVTDYTALNRYVKRPVHPFQGTFCKI